MPNSISLAYEVLRLIREGVAPATQQERAGMKLALAVVAEHAMDPGPGPWTLGFDSMARKVARAKVLDDLGPREIRRRLRRSVLDESPVMDAIARILINEKVVEEPATETPGERRVIYRQSGSRLYRIEQERKMVWQTQSVKRVVAMDVDTQEAPKEVQTELDRLAPLDPRD